MWGGGGGRRLLALLTDVMGFPSVINDSHLWGRMSHGAPIYPRQRRWALAAPGPSLPHLSSARSCPGPTLARSIQGAGAQRAPGFAGPLSLARFLLRHAPLWGHGPGALSPKPQPSPHRGTDPASGLPATHPGSHLVQGCVGGVSG